MRFARELLRNSRRRFTKSYFSLAFENNLNSAVCAQPTCLMRSETPTSTSPLPLRCLRHGFPALFSYLSSSIRGNSDAPGKFKPDDDNSDEENGEDVEASEDDDDNVGGRTDSKKEDLLCNVRTIVEILRTPGANGLVVRNKLEQCGVAAKPELVAKVLSQVRNNWEAAFAFFLWAGRQPGYAHSLREYHSMISILGKMRKFDTAWALIDEMRGGRIGPSLVVPHTLLIMIRKYCAVHDVGKAINTFYAYRRFNFKIGMDEFHDLLSALCRYKNVKDAEYLLFCNKNVFPLNTKSFNIILNGWCNIIRNSSEAKRIWREMKERGIPRDVISYASIISCYSKLNQLNVVLKLFNQMKALNISPDTKVYNAVIYALAKDRLVQEARNLMKTMEDNGVTPNTVTYNSLITPLCRAHRSNEALEVFDEMLKQGLSPTVQTYHALFCVTKTGEEVFSLLQSMTRMGCHPNHDTYITLIRKFCRWRQLDIVFKLWNGMIGNGLDPDRSSYIVLIHGLFLNGKLAEAYKYSQEMRDKHLPPEPKIDEMLQAWLSGKQNLEQKMKDLENNTATYNQSADKRRASSAKRDLEGHFLQRPEARKVVRARGFSFWER